MPAPRGNQFWKLRSTHGREKLFATPELMWEAACEYFDWCIKHPLIEEDYRGKDAIKVNLRKMRPFTMHGLCLYLDCSTSYFRNFKANLQKDQEDFLTVVTRIEETIYNQKFTGAASGFLNPNIIARDLGLAEKSELTGHGGTPLVPKPNIDYTQLSDEILIALANARPTNKS